MLPVVETEILPTKHYVPSTDKDGNKILIEIPESRVTERTGHEFPSPNWEIKRTSPEKGDRSTAAPPQESNQGQYTEDDEGADGPIIGLARGEQRTTRSRGNSKSSVFSNSNHTKSPSKSSNPLAPILSSKKESVTKDGVPKTEFVWRHPPVFENASGQIRGPVYISAGLGDPSGIPYEIYHSDQEDVEWARKPGRGEEDLLFRDSGYGSGGMLPGLTESAPMVTGMGLGRVADENREVSRNRAGKAKAAPNVEGEVTKGLRQMRERRRSSAASQESGSKNDVAGVVTGMKGMSVKGDHVI